MMGKIMFSSERRRYFLKVFTVGIAAVLGGRSPARGQAALPVIAGAIRWDAWAATGSAVQAAVAASLGPEDFHARAPFCALPAGRQGISFAGCRTQDAMDAEIAAAAKAGLGYWAYCWYGAGNPMMNAWALHQASGIREQMKWCMLLQFSRLGGAAAFAQAGEDYLRYFAQPNYQQIAGRPLVYLFIDQPDHLAADWAGNWANLATAWRSLTQASPARS
jgi:hypothetical protein